MDTESPYRYAAGGAALLVYLWLFGPPAAQTGKMWLFCSGVRQFNQRMHSQPFASRAPTPIIVTPSVTEAVAQVPTASALAFLFDRHLWAHMFLMAIVFFPVFMTVYTMYVDFLGMGWSAKAESGGEMPSEIVRLRWRSIAWKALVSSSQKARFGCAFVRDCFKMAYGEAMKKNEQLKTGLVEAWKTIEKLQKARGEAEQMVKDLKDEVSNKPYTLKEAEAANAELIKAFFCQLQSSPHRIPITDTSAVAQDELKLTADEAIKVAYQDGWSAGYSRETERSKRERNKAYEQGAIEQTCVLSRDLEAADQALEEARLRVRVLRKIAFKSMAGSHKALEDMTNHISLYKTLFRMTGTTSIPQPSTNEGGQDAGTDE
ncbi:MAG: hypothetical protein Q9212_004822 [Teloschistes hypoglaucus]